MPFSVNTMPPPGGEGDSSVVPPGGSLPESVALHQLVVGLRDDLCVRNCELALARQQVQSKELEMRALRAAGRGPGDTGRAQEDALRYRIKYIHNYTLIYWHYCYVIFFNIY